MDAWKEPAGLLKGKKARRARNQAMNLDLLPLKETNKSGKKHALSEKSEAYLLDNLIHLNV